MAAYWPFPEKPKRPKASSVAKPKEPKRPKKPKKPKSTKAAWPFPEKLEPGAAAPAVSAADMAKLVKFFEGSPSLVGDLLGVSASTVQRWLKTGVPAARRGAPDYVRRVLDLFEVARKSLEEAQTFAELMKLAGEVNELPHVTSGGRAYSGKAVDGWQWTRRVERQLSEEVISDMARFGNSRRGRAAWKYWMVVVMTSQYALTSRKDFGAASRADNYKTVSIQLAHVKSGDFVAGRAEPTGRHESKESAVNEMVELFGEMLVDAELRVFVHGVTVYNYRLRSPEERRAIETAGRKERRKK